MQPAPGSYGARHRGGANVVGNMSIQLARRQAERAIAGWERIRRVVTKHDDACGCRAADDGETVVLVR